MKACARYRDLSIDAYPDLSCSCGRHALADL
jgi:hypothetical protein